MDAALDAKPLLPPFRLHIPARKEAIDCAQHLVQWFAERAGMPERRRFAINLAIEELILTLLHYAFDDGREEGELEMTVQLKATLLKVQVTCRGLPFDLSMVPNYQPDADAEEASLSVLLLKHMVDRYHLYNEGKNGYRIELEWLKPLTHVSAIEDDTPAPGPGAAAREPAPIAGIRPLKEEEALALARLVYRSYGYSYVSEYLYYPERIVARMREGMLCSWVAVSENGELAGHAALMRSGPDATAVEWGIAVVDPRWRGLGLLSEISAELMKYAAGTPARVVFVHSVTNHPYTQRSALQLGMEHTALLLGYAPSSLQFRHIHERLLQRESTFIGIRLLKPLPEQPVHLPDRHAEILNQLAQGAGVRLIGSAERHCAARMPWNSTFDSMIEPAVNVAYMNLTRIGADLEAALAHERRRLCREKVDVIYLNIDLTDIAAADAVDIAEAQGFFLAGLTPMQPWPYTLTLQYLNNLDFDFDAIQAVGDQAQRLKQYVERELRRIAD